MGLLDIVSKTILNEGPQDLIRLACPNLRIDSVTSLEKEVFSVQRSADKPFQIHQGNEESPLHLHIEVKAQWESDLSQRMHETWMLFSTKHAKLDSILIVLKFGEVKKFHTFISERALGPSKLSGPLPSKETPRQSHPAKGVFREDAITHPNQVLCVSATLP